MYAALLRPEWTALDIIEHTEETVHRVVRLRNEGARPPYLKCHRTSADELVVIYDSERRLCRLAFGILRGIANKRQENLRILERTCMQSGAPACAIVVTAAR